MNPVVKADTVVIIDEPSSSQQPLIARVTLDPFSTAAIFALYNVLNEKDRFGISGHTLFRQPSIPIGKIPYLDWEVNSQTLSRKIYSSSREEASDFVIAIIESTSAYLKHESFRKMLPNLEIGLVRYVKSYGLVTDNATTSFQLAIDRINEAILWNKPHEDFRTKHIKEFPKELTQDRVKFYDYWSEEEITHVVNGIHLAIQKKSKGENCEAEIESTLKYLEIKQKQTIPLLESKLKTLHHIK